MSWADLLQTLKDICDKLADPGEIDSDGREQELAEAIKLINRARSILKGARGGSP